MATVGLDVSLIRVASFSLCLHQLPPPLLHQSPGVDTVESAPLECHWCWASRIGQGRSAGCTGQ